MKYQARHIRPSDFEGCLFQLISHNEFNALFDEVDYLLQSYEPHLNRHYQKVHDVLRFSINRHPDINSFKNKQHLRSLLDSLVRRKNHSNLYLHSMLFECLCNLNASMRDFWDYNDGDINAKPQSMKNIRDLCMNDLLLHGQSPHAYTFLALLNHLEDNYSGTAEYFCKAIESADFLYSVRSYNNGIFTYLPPTEESYELLDFFENEPPVTMLMDIPATDVSCALVFCCDNRYFQAFGPGILDSLCHFGRNYWVHFHVVNLDGTGRNLFQKMNRKNEHISLSLSYEIIETPEPALLASIRILRLRKLLLLPKHDVIVFDTDIEFRKSPHSLYEIDTKIDVALNIRRGFPSHIPWRTVTAQTMFFRNNENGLRFVDILDATTRYLFQSHSGNKWWIDQNALFASSVFVQHFHSDIVVKANYDPFSYFVHAKEHKESCLATISQLSGHSLPESKCKKCQDIA
jgi:hypothetical protein